MFCSVQSAVFSLLCQANVQFRTQRYGQHTNERADEREREEKKPKVLILCNTRVEDGWRDEAGLVSERGSCRRVHIRIDIRSVESQINF